MATHDRQTNTQTGPVMSTTMMISPQISALGASVIAFAATPGADREFVVMWNAFMKVVADNWSIVLVVIRSLCTGLASAYFMGASMQDMLYASPVLSLITHLALALFACLMAASYRSASVVAANATSPQSKDITYPHTS